MLCARAKQICPKLAGLCKMLDQCGQCWPELEPRSSQTGRVGSNACLIRPRLGKNPLPVRARRLEFAHGSNCRAFVRQFRSSRPMAITATCKLAGSFRACLKGHLRQTLLFGICLSFRHWRRLGRLTMSQHDTCATSMSRRVRTMQVQRRCNAVSERLLRTTPDFAPAQGRPPIHFASRRHKHSLTFCLLLRKLPDMTPGPTHQSERR